MVTPEPSCTKEGSLPQGAELPKNAHSPSRTPPAAVCHLKPRHEAQKKQQGQNHPHPTPQTQGQGAAGGDAGKALGSLVVGSALLRGGRSTRGRQPTALIFPLQKKKGSQNAAPIRGMKTPKLAWVGRGEKAVGTTQPQPPAAGRRPAVSAGTRPVRQAGRRESQQKLPREERGAWGAPSANGSSASPGGAAPAPWCGEPGVFGFRHGSTGGFFSSQEWLRTSTTLGIRC